MKRAIIPAAGLGTRMGMLPNQSKELLIDPVTNQPLIQWHFNYCAKYNLVPLVVTRKEKTDLIEYCNKQNIQVLIVEPKGEWYDTIQQSKSYWEEMNIVLFPDSKFADDRPLPDEFFSSFSIYNYVACCFGVQNVVDSSKWCVVTLQGIYEKKQNGPGTAIVVFGFRKDTDLFEQLSINQTARLIDYHLFQINNFTDLTRTGVIEKVYV